MSIQTLKTQGYGTYGKPSAKGNRWAFVGDSIPGLNGSGRVATFENVIDNYTGHLPALSMGKIQWAGSWSAPGKTIAQVRAGVLASMLVQPAALLPNRCVISAGTNDIGSSGWSLTRSSSVADLQGCCADLTGAGIEPVLITVPPRGDSTTANQNAQVWNTWVTGFAQSRGYALLDLWTALVDPATGGYKSGYAIADGIHPSPTGMKAIADYLAGTTLFNTIPSWSVQRAKTSTEQTNAVSNAVMLNSTSGLANGWNSWGSPAFTIVAPQTSDGINGNWQQIAVGASGAGGGFQYNTATMSSLGWSAGDTVAMTLRLQTAGINSAGFTATNYLSASLSLPDATNTNQDSIAYGTSRDVDELVYLERPLRSDTNKLQVNVTWPSPTAAIQIRVAEVSIRNLTQNGLGR